MAQKGAQLGIVQRLNTLKGWASNLKVEVPLTPKPAAQKSAIKRKFKKTKNN